MDLGGLLGRMVPDAITFFDRVLQQAQDQLTRDGVIAAGAKMSPDDIVATALGNRLAGMIVNEDASTASLPADELSYYEELLDRNSVLAAALGACDCWGQDVTCPFCDGVGGPGWAPPDQRLFASYIRPALAAVPSTGGSSTVPRHAAQSRGKEGGDG
jgi:hypothetical protein